MSAAISVRWSRGSSCDSLRPAFLWNGVYRGIEIGRLWIGWTNPDYKRRGW